MLLRRDLRSIIETTQRHDRNSTFRIDAGHARATSPAEGLGKEAGLGNLELPDFSLTVGETQIFCVDHQIACVSSAAGPVAAHAMAMPRRNRPPFEDEADLAAKTASPHPTRWIEWLPSLASRRIDTGRVGIEGRQVILDLAAGPWLRYPARRGCPVRTPAGSAGRVETHCGRLLLQCGSSVRCFPEVAWPGKSGGSKCRCW